MPDTPKNKDQEKRDEVLRRLPKMPQKPKPLTAAKKRKLAKKASG
ncbi:hypothetical protein X749_07330 [Mesorhizobium sp. LNJC391B00]|nr:hypothetical protein X749_07330 [Mesorhizobium sp. LNJC391B00]